MVIYNVIILAAGQGKRMNAGRNKQFIELLNKPLIIHTLEKFVRDEWCDKIYLVINPTEQQVIEELISTYRWRDRIQLVHGGQERQESGYKGLLAIESKGQSHVVMIHDGARPFVGRQHLHNLAIAAKDKGAALLAVPVTDTIKQRAGEKLATFT